MTGGGRKRGSKWDLKEERQHSLESIRDGSWPARPGMPFHDRETERDWLSQGVAQGVAGRKSDKWAIMEAKDMKKSKHGLPSRNVISGSRGSYKSDRTNPDIVKDWDEDINYNMKMSPGLDDWRQQQNKRNSPEADWNRPCRSRSWSKSRSRSQSRSRSRSRSQSPAHGFRRQSGFQERTRSRSGVSSQICKDFSIGRCRRGNRCQFLHEDIQNDEDGWDTRHRKIGASRYTSPYDSKEYLMKNGRPTDYCSDFLKGNCRKGASCRFVHDGPPNGFAERSTSATTRERERERERNRDLSPQQGGEHEHRRSDIPCKFFAAGICRKGKNCKFSHDSLTCASPERSHDDRRGHVRNSSHGDKSWDGQKRSDMDASSDSKRLWDGPKWNDAEASNDVEKSWRGSKWSRSDAYTSTAFSEEKHDKMHVAERRSSGWSISNRGEHVSDLNGACLDLKLSHNAVNSSEKDEGWTKTEKSGTSEPRGIEESLVDMEMSPEWNYKIQQPVTSDVKQERGHIPPSSKSLAHDNNSLAQTRDSFVISQPVATEASFFQKEHITREGTAVVLPSDNKVAIRNSAASTIDLNFSTHILPGQSFDQNAPSSSSFPFSHLSTAVQNQVAVSSDSTLGSLRACQNPGLHQEERSSKRLIIGETEVPQVNSGTQNMVRNEQLAQLTNLSASLAQIFGNGQPQLPGLYAALNSQNAMQVPSLANSGGLVKPPTEQKQYDPISDCIEPKPKQDGSTKILGFSVNSAGEEKNMEGKSEKISDGIYSIQERQRDGDHYNNNNSERDPDLKGYQSNQQEPVADSEAPKENGEYEETKKAQNENKSGPLDNIDGDEKADESKKVKEGKGVRAFKFALVEFVKDLLKPTWREGQISKEAYKSIVKKVVDKVTTAVQGTNIPQSQEKIDQYLSSSKPKLSKLVQAYVEKRQKG